jgi:hypothetical protein
LGAFFSVRMAQVALRAVVFEDLGLGRMACSINENRPRGFGSRAVWFIGS